MNPEPMFKRHVAPADDLLNRAFELAYFILGDRSASIYVAMAAMDKLKAALTRQDRRLHYVPTGRAAYPAARTKVNLSEAHLLQRLVYVESELFERLLEGQRKTIQKDDLIIRYIKHLIRITMKHNSFYVTLGLCRLLYNYSTGETSEIYNVVIQDPERIRDDYYYRSRKKHLMADIKERFGNLLRIERGFRREDRFHPQEDSQKYANLVKECLKRFTPWDSVCVLPQELSPRRDVLTQLSFEGGDPDKEHRVELNRIHTLIDSECFERLTLALGLGPVKDRLALPAFFASSEGSWPAEDRLNPIELTEGELEAIRRYLDKNVTRRQRFSEAQVSVLVDGMKRGDLELKDSRERQFKLEDGSELIEIRSIGSTDLEEDTSLAISLLKYNQSGIAPAEFAVLAGKDRQLSLTVLPWGDASTEGGSAMLKVSCLPRPTTQTISVSIQNLGSQLYELIRVRQLGELRIAIALGLLLLAVGAAGWWIYSSRHRNARNSAELAQVEKPREGETASPSKPSSTAPQAQTVPSTSPHETPQSPTIGSIARRTQSNQSTRIGSTRGTERNPPSAMLLDVKRVYVDPLGDDSFANLLRENLTGALRASQRFTVVSTRDDADAVFRGSTRQVLTSRRNPSVVLELVNANGKVIWTLSSRKNGTTVSNDAQKASAVILDVLRRDIERLRRKN